MDNNTVTYQYLKFIGSQKLSNWSVKYLLEDVFTYNENYPLVAIKEILKRNKTQIDIQDNLNYKRATIKINNGGIFLRDITLGKNIGTKKQFRISKGQFLLSKIDARNGAFGVVPEVVDNGIITGNFWTYDVDYLKVNPHYLALITTTQQFISFCQRSSAGTTNRHYLQENLFLNEKIPLPILLEQEKLVKEYQDKLQQAEQLNNEANNFKSELDNKLGISNTKIEFNQGILKFVDFKNIEKWGLDQIFKSHTQYNGKYKTLKILDLCLVSSGGTPSRGNRSFYNGDIPWIKTGEVIDKVIYETEEKITLEAIKNSSAKLYPTGSLVVAMYGQGKTRGRTAKLGIDATTNQACAVLYKINNDIVITDYLWIYLMNEYDRLRELASGNNQPNLNADMIKNYPVVIPPFEIQTSIIDDFNTLRNFRNQKSKQAETLRTEAIADFENAIFG
ncbi:restriction endonuclease subunit S [Pedobacter sp. KR3-3]|uniref:Restriction endonuclease subunit S n=1 Tax=Pedobacter albus TaxID=3113905 RepID=A0ABU7IBT5_9SPHI|nr:restriction endonuclease subunit S [Pedobacter sp. KR3-3]MEE1946932.1 restriction endonuclease subunit S [Pedobacter sp. KR3-3]